MKICIILNLICNNTIINGNVEKQINNVNSTVINNYYINNYKNERLDYVDYEKLLNIFTKTYDIRLLTKEYISIKTSLKIIT